MVMRLFVYLTNNISNSYTVAKGGFVHDSLNLDEFVLGRRSSAWEQLLQDGNRRLAWQRFHFESGSLVERKCLGDECVHVDPLSASASMHIVHVHHHVSGHGLRGHPHFLHLAPVKTYNQQQPQNQSTTFPTFIFGLFVVDMILWMYMNNWMPTARARAHQVLLHQGLERRRDCEQTCPDTLVQFARQTSLPKDSHFPYKIHWLLEW